VSAPPVRLGLRENRGQFALLVAVNAFVGAMIGLERSTLPLIGRSEFGVGSSAAVLSFVVAFGAAKALTNLGAGALAARLGRRRLLIAGWVVALPVPVLVGVAPSWGWIVAANVLLGVNQGLAWSMTVVMKIDLVGPARRGLALGLNEAAGYGGVALTAVASGWLAADFAARDVLVVAGAAIAVVGLVVSIVFVRDTAAHVALEQAGDAHPAPRLREAFRDATWRVPALRACSQAGLVNNLNDALAWGLVPLFLAAHGASVGEIGIVAGVYPAVWGLGQVVTGHWSDVAGRKPLIVGGMLLQAAALAVLAASDGAVFVAATAAVLLGAGTALVYPTLLAAISDAVAPVARAPVVGVYRFWRDSGYVAGGLVAGVVADALGFSGAIAVVAALTAASGLWVAVDLPRPPRNNLSAMRHRRRPAVPLAVVVAGLSLASCGGGSPPSEEERARDTVAEFLAALREGDDDDACARLTRRAQQGLPQLLVLLRPDNRSAVDVVTGSQECPHLAATLRRFLRAAGRFGDLRGEARHAEIAPSGRTGTVRVHSGRLTTTWPVEKQGSDWRISEVALGTVKKVEEEEGGEGESEAEEEREDERGGN
jgi:MFS family permease